MRKNLMRILNKYEIRKIAAKSYIDVFADIPTFAMRTSSSHGILYHFDQE